MASVNATPNAGAAASTSTASSGGADAQFDAILARIEAAGIKRAERDAKSTESKEAVGALKNVARATSA
ncbi:MAG: hypothetical protein ACR2QF_09500 [Geminicoccaceae bacterium]